MVKVKFDRDVLLEINLIECGKDKYFEVFNYMNPYLGYQTDDLDDLLDYLESSLIEVL